MNMTLARRGAALVAVVALFTLIGQLGLPRETAASAPPVVPVELGPAVSVPIPSDVRAALVEGARSDAALGAPRPLGPAQDKDLIAFEQFEGATWPPEGWLVVDRKVASGTPARFAWGRETCEVPPTTGGSGAAWSIGGGSEGSQLACWAPYSQPVETWLVYQGIDTTNYPGGLSLQFNFKLDMPRNDAFRFCLIRDPSSTQAQCYTFNNLTEAQRNRWLNLADSVLENTSGYPALSVAFLYLDDTPNGTTRGAIVDNILMEGLKDAQQPTEPSQTNQPPGPTRTPLPPTEIPPPPGTRIYMPVAMMRARASDFPSAPTAEPLPTGGPAGVLVGLGLAIDQDTGDLLAPGPAYQYGQLHLCQVTRWSDATVGTPLSWQWFLDGQALQGDINRQAVPVPYVSGWAGMCLQYQPGGTGPLLPLPKGTWRIDVWLGGTDTSRAPDSSAQAVIQDAAPPGATELPPPEPSATPRPTSTAGPTAVPGTYTCRNVLVNGDFEQGPNIGWNFDSNALINGQPATLEGVILRYDAVGINAPAGGGAWLSLLGRGTGIRMDLIQKDAVATFDPARVVSATLEYTFAMQTQEQRNGTHDDLLATFVRTPSGEMEQIGGALTEENTDPGMYYTVTTRAVDQIIRRAGWDSFMFWIASRNNDVAETATVHLIDSFALNVCESKTDLTPAQIRARDAAGPTMTIRPIPGRVIGDVASAPLSARGALPADVPMHVWSR
jgi:hypothetical protein